MSIETMIKEKLAAEGYSPEDVLLIYDMAYASLDKSLTTARASINLVSDPNLHSQTQAVFVYLSAEYYSKVLKHMAVAVSSEAEVEELLRKNGVTL